MCESLESITIPEGTITSLPDRTFEACDLLKDVNLPSTLREIGEDCFGSCPSLASIKLPDSLKYIHGGAFYDCPSLTELELPEGLVGIGDGVIAYSGVRELRIPESVEWLSKECFVRSEELETLIIDAPLETLPTYALYGNTKLKNLHLCDDIEDISFWSIISCPSIETLVLPSALKHIGFQAVMFCSSLTTIQCNAVTPPDADESPFDESLYSQATLLVPQQSVEAYKNHPVWKRFFNINGITTAVEAVNAVPTVTHKPIHNLRGQEIKSEKGIYIKGGKVRIRN